jgi:hypothetical protein
MEERNMGSQLYGMKAYDPLYTFLMFLMKNMVLIGKWMVSGWKVSSSC